MTAVTASEATVSGTTVSGEAVPVRGSRALPDLEPNRELVLPPSRERTLPNGLTVIAIERRTVPLVELRLRMPFGRAVLDPPFVAKAALLSQTLFSGTDTMSTVDIAAALQSVGGAMSASVDTDRLLVTGNGLASGLGQILDILAQVLRGATYPAGEVETERGRLIDRILVAQSQPSHLVREALLRRMYTTHPYAVQTPTADDVRVLGTGELAGLHSARVRPDGATLIVVGDIDALQTLDQVEAVLGSWTGASGDEELPPTLPLSPGPVMLVDRPSAVQSSLRLALPAVPRTHPDHAALQLANLVFGGYFSSRWMENLREVKGYTYAVLSAIEHSVAGSALVLSTDVATDVTGPAVLETWYELGRLAVLPPTPAELEQARQYALGTLLLSMATQAGLAGLASTYAGFGLRLDYLVSHAARLAATTREDVAAVAQRFFAPAKAATVVLGDAAKVEASLAALSQVERSTVERSTVE